jgi:hypothetical protein
MALLEKASRQGHVYAMETLAGVHHEREEYDRKFEWTTKARAYIRARQSST